MSCQLTITLVFAALAVGLMYPITVAPGVLLQLHAIEVSEATRVHVRAAVRSTQQMILALPCLLPPVAALPFVCGGSLIAEVGRPSCIGAFELLFDQQALTGRLVHYTLPSRDFLTPLSSAIDIVEDVLASEEGDGICLDPVTDSLDMGTLIQRCVTGAYDLSEQMRLTVSR